MSHNRVGLDTSIIVRLMTGEPSDLAHIAHDTVRALLAEGKELAVSDLVVAETYFALHNYYGIPKQQVLNRLSEFLSTPSIVAIGEAGHVLQQPNLGSSKPGFVDRMIHAQYMKEASYMLSFEKAAEKLPRSLVIKSKSL